MSLEHLILLGVFALFPLLQVVRRWLRRGAAAPAPPEPVRGARERAFLGQATPVGRPVEPPKPRARPLAPSPPAPGPRAESARPAFRLRSPREARRAIIAMTVFGPCRALEPPRLRLP